VPSPLGTLPRGSGGDAAAAGRERNARADLPWRAAWRAGCLSSRPCAAAL